MNITKETQVLSHEITILVVDDNLDFLEIMREVLQPEGYRVVTTASGLDAIASFDKIKPSLVLLDIKLPDMKGYVVCEYIRRASQVPIIIISGYHLSEEDKVTGFEAGADDYIVKPVLNKELLSRIKVALRHSDSLDVCADKIFRYEDLAIYFNLNRVTLNDQSVDLTATEYRLLTFLACNAGRIISHEEILDNLWKDEGLICDSHLVRVNIGRLRRKLNDVDGLTYITTKPGRGYIMNGPDRLN
jgi:two-component system, OmpR family, KDP operon response regulator KdpE